MKVIRSAIHKMTVEGTCGCIVAGEYSDAAYKAKVGATSFKACKDHEGKPGVEMLEDILGQALDKEALEFRLPEVPVNRPSPARSEARLVTDEPSQDAPVVNRPQGKKLTPAGAAPRVMGGGGIRRVNPSAMVPPSRAKAAAATSAASGRTGSLKVAGTATSSGGLDIDIDAAPEDPRVTKMLKEEGLESILDAAEPDFDGGDEGGDGDFDTIFDD